MSTQNPMFNNLFVEILRTTSVNSFDYYIQIP